MPCLINSETLKMTSQVESFLRLDKKKKRDTWGRPEDTAAEMLYFNSPQ